MGIRQGKPKRQDESVARHLTCCANELESYPRTAAKIDARQVIVEAINAAFRRERAFMQPLTFGNADSIVRPRYGLVHQPILQFPET